MLNSTLNLYALNIVAGVLCATGVMTIIYGICAVFGTKQDGVGE